jgi:L-threonylcarbamoyladenylate synthase
MPAYLHAHTRMLSSDAAAIAEAADCLARGGLVAFPTETVYGLGADATNGEAIARLYAAKGRPKFNPLIAHVTDIAAAQVLARFNADALKLAEVFWPGPLTLVLPRTASCLVADLATAGLETIAVRIPKHPVAQDLLRSLGRPIVAPSANRSGHVSPTTAQHVHDDLDGRIDLIVDSGPTEVGLESTIVACLDSAPRLLRAGGIPREDIGRITGIFVGSEPHRDEAAHEAPLAPGMLASHYAPRTPVRLNAQHVEAGEALLAFGSKLPEGFERAMAIASLSRTGDLIEAAAQLFAQLRALDAVGAKSIAVMPIPDIGLGEAINDRLLRSANNS